ncbi:a-type inclusion protein [Anaeramoeba ignava]|uniref:A-type inclusion protein n=1 Tax=Anaeramoeba ignava TaxID=1746090 RepID=A0A9Q0LS01_ANAIG|nr:a-type inclusion protein [Anaeramoeba ignava]
MGNVNSAKKKILKKQTKEYKKKIAQFSEAITHSDEKGNFLYVNKAAVKMFKAKSKNEILSRNAGSLAAAYQPAFKMPTYQAIGVIGKNIFESPDGFYDFDFLHIDLDGKEFWCHVWLTPINLGGKMVLQGYTRPVSEPGITKTLDLSQEAAFFVKPVSEKQSKSNSKSSNSKTETDSQTDSFVGDGLKSTTELSDTENPVNFSEKTKTESIQKTKDLQDRIESLTTSSHSSIILFDNDENEVQLQNRIDKIKSTVRSHDNPVLEKTVVEELNEIKKIFSNSTQTFQKQISQLAEKLQKERNQNQEKYSQLESHLQKSLAKTQEAQNGYETLVNKMKIIEEVFDNKLNQILHPKSEKQN